MAQVSKSKTTFDNAILLPGLIFIIGVCLVSVIFPAQTEQILNVVKQYIFINLNWVYVWAVTIFVIFLIYLMFSKYGKIKLGDNDAEPEHSFFSWIAMLFAAGMGIGLMYFGVGEPLSHYANNVFDSNHYVSKAKNAQLYTFFHWGVHAWSVYGLVGLSLAYFSYRYKLPMSLRSCLYPLLKEKINGKWGDSIDVFALCSTFFGITTTLGFGVIQINSGLKTLHVLPESSFKYQIIIVCVLVTMAVVSAASGVNKGIKYLSNINILAAMGLLIFVLILGPTVYLIGSFTDGLGNYINNFFNITFDTHVYEEKTLPWFYDWTILYWAWWISWAPFVGLFIARISKGRTIKSFIGAVLIIPTLFNFVWMIVFGNSAIWIDFHVAEGALSKLVNIPDELMFKFLDYLPFSTFSSWLVIIIVIIFFTTSADSGILVLDSIATRNSNHSPLWQKILWGALLVLLSLILLNGGGLKALQTMTLITALPFAVIMLFFVASLMKALLIDHQYYERRYSVSTAPWSGEFWKQRLKQMVSLKSEESVEDFIDHTVFQAFTELQEELRTNGVISKINKTDHPVSLELEIKYDTVNNFKYGVRSDRKVVSALIAKEKNLPDYQSKQVFIPITFFGDSREGYDVQYFTKNELISDVLKQYERFINIISDENNELFISSNSNVS